MIFVWLTEMLFIFIFMMWLYFADVLFFKDIFLLSIIPRTLGSQDYWWTNRALVWTHRIEGVSGTCTLGCEYDNCWLRGYHWTWKCTCIQLEHYINKPTLIHELLGGELFKMCLYMWLSQRIRHFLLLPVLYMILIFFTV